MSGYDKSRIVGVSSKVLDEHTCGICHMVFNTPVVTKCCGQTYCKACIEEWLSNHNNCPNDRKCLQIIELEPLARFATNLLNDMKIKCEYEENGCKDITTISDLVAHQKECQFRPNIDCAICGLYRFEGEVHNCIDNLIIEKTRLQKENQKLKIINENSTPGMTSVLLSVRNSIDNYKIVEPILGITQPQKESLISYCQEAIKEFDSYRAISTSMCSEINTSSLFKGPKSWHVIIFSKEGGLSFGVKLENYIRIEFDRLVIVVFTS